MAERLLIDQKRTYAADFGLVFRAAATFWATSTEGASTTLSFMNYWRVKRGLEVSVVLTTRGMDGTILARELVDWRGREVVNHRVDLGGAAEGAIEVEVFSNRNLVIPFPAVMALYETPGGLSMVHSYARTYSPIEVEAGRTVEVGREGGFTVRDDADTRSFCVFHNGYEVQPAQTITARCVNAEGETRSAQIALEALAPHQSVRLEPASIFPGLADFLGGRPGNVAVAFQLARGFTRMLVGNRRVDDLQVTHSNFDYSAHRTDLVEGEQEAEMTLASAPGRPRTVLIYPESEPGLYAVETDLAQVEFASGRRIEAAVEQRDVVRLLRRDGPLPSRIVTAQVVGNGPRLPAECSLGVVHRGRPPKHSHWAVLSARPGHRSRLSGTAAGVYGAPSGGATLSLHSAGSETATVLKLDAQATLELMQGRDPLSLPGADEFDAGADYYFAYLNLDHPGWIVFSSIETEQGVMTLEHAF